MQQLNRTEADLQNVLDVLRHTKPEIVDSIIRLLGVARPQFGSVSIIFLDGKPVTTEKRETFKA